MGKLAVACWGLEGTVHFQFQSERAGGIQRSRGRRWWMGRVRGGCMVGVMARGRGCEVSGRTAERGKFLRAWPIRVREGSRDERA